MPRPLLPAGWIILALGLAILVGILPFLVGLLGAGVLYVICAPAQRRLERRIGVRWAAAIVLVGALLLILFPGAVLVTVAMEEGPEIVGALPESEVFRRISAFRVGGMAIGAHVAAASGTLVSWISGQAVAVFGSVTRTLLNLIISFFGLYFLLVAPPGSWEDAREYLPFQAADAEYLRGRFRSVTEAALWGIALTALAQGTIVGASFGMVGLPNALFWAMITAIVSVLPVLGSAIVWLPGSLVLFFEGRYGPALFLFLVGALVASNVDNLLRLIVFKRVSNIHPLVTLVGAFAGVRYMGLVGVLFGPLMITYFFELLKVYRRGASGEP